MTNIGRMYGITQEPPAPKEDRKAKAEKAVDRVTEKYAPTVTRKPKDPGIRTNLPEESGKLMRMPGSEVKSKGGRPRTMAPEDAQAKRKAAERERQRRIRAAKKAGSNG